VTAKRKDDPPPLVVGRISKLSDPDEVIAGLIDDREAAVEDLKKRLRVAHMRACERSSANAVVVSVAKDLFETAIFHAEREQR
jgi:hypothetical protein